MAPTQRQQQQQASLAHLAAAAASQPQSNQDWKYQANAARALPFAGNGASFDGQSRPFSSRNDATLTRFCSESTSTTTAFQCATGLSRVSYSLYDSLQQITDPRERN